MAAPLGFKTFNTGDVLSAADTNGYLMQGIWVFADATARDAAVTSPQEGNSCYLKDTDVIQVYSGSSWVVKSGGSSPLTTKGDLYTYSTTDTRLPVGTNGHTLVADSAEATGLKWAAPAGGGANWSLLNAGGTSLTGAQTITVSGISGKDKILVLFAGASSANASGYIGLRLNTDTASNYAQRGGTVQGASTYAAGNVGTFDVDPANFIYIAEMSNNAGSAMQGYCELSGCNSAGLKVFTLSGAAGASGGSGHRLITGAGFYNSASTISSVSAFSNTGNFDGGTIFVYTSA